MQGQGTVTPAKMQAYPEATVVDIAALPAAGLRFERWEGPVADPFAPETTVLVDSSLTVHAVFTPTSAPVFKEAPGGLIAVPPRPGGVQYIMLHAISDAALNPADPYQIERIGAIFREYGVESHYVIDRDGTIYRFAADHLTARHAGRGSGAILNSNMRHLIGC